MTTKKTITKSTATKTTPAKTTAFTKRTKVNGSGRKKGTPNKTTSDLKNWVFDFVNSNLDTFKTKFKNLTTEEQFAIILRLLPYVLPKQTENKISFDAELANAVKESMDKINGLFE